MKRFLTLILIVFVSLSSVVLAAKRTVRIARLPIIIQKNILDKETASLLEMKMARAVKIPLNQTLKVVEYLPPKDCQNLLGGIWQRMYAQNRKVQLAEVVKIFAEEMNADLIICPVLHQYSQRVSPISGNFETHLSSNVSAELIIYDKKTDNLIDKETSRNFSNNYNRYGTASYLASECFDQLIQDTELRQIIRDIK